MQAMFPDPRFRSPTAVPGKSAVRDDNIVSAAVLQHGGAGQVKLFTVPQGQSIPTLKGSSITASTQAHHLLHTDLTTTLTQAGQLGSAIGDISVRAIGINLEQAAVTLATGLPRVFGMSQFEVQDVLSKCFFTLKVSETKQSSGPVFLYPSMGGAVGSISTTGNAATAGVVSNGAPGQGRGLKMHIPIGRTDNIDAVLGVAGGASLAFTTTNGEGNPSLVWCTLRASVAADVRG